MAPSRAPGLGWGRRRRSPSGWRRRASGVWRRVLHVQVEHHLRDLAPRVALSDLHETVVVGGADRVGPRPPPAASTSLGDGPELLARVDVAGLEEPDPVPVGVSVAPARRHGLT